MISHAKGLSLTQPFASLIASGEKTIETRRWRTSYRGPLLICATKEIKPLWEHLPRGVALCLVDLVDIRLMTNADEEAACCTIYPNAWAWVLENLRQVEPTPIRGKQSLFDVHLDEGMGRWVRSLVSGSVHGQQATLF